MWLCRPEYWVPYRQTCFSWLACRPAGGRTSRQWWGGPVSPRWRGTPEGRLWSENRWWNSSLSSWLRDYLGWELPSTASKRSDLGEIDAGCLLTFLFHFHSVFVIISCDSPTFASILVTTWPMSSLHSGMLGLNRSRFALKLRGMTWKLSRRGQNTWRIKSRGFKRNYRENLQATHRTSTDVC